MSDLVGEIDIILHENKHLREQNRVLREALQEIASDIKGNPKRKQMLADDDFWAAPGEHTLRQWIAKAALTATSQPVPPYKEWCRHPEKCAGLASCPQDPTCAD